MTRVVDKHKLANLFIVNALERRTNLTSGKKRMKKSYELNWP